MTRPDRDERSSVNPTPRNALPPTSVAAKLSVRTTLARATEAFPGWWLGVIAAGAVAVLILAFWLLSPPQRSDLWFEVGKGCIQLVVVVLLGAVAKILVDEYQRRQALEDQNRVFRKDKYNSLVSATNSLRKVAIEVAIAADTSKLDAEMRAVMNVGLDLRMIKHQVFLSRHLPHRPFHNADQLADLIEVMYHYTEAVLEDFPGVPKARTTDTVWTRVNASFPSLNGIMESTLDVSQSREQMATMIGTRDSRGAVRFPDQAGGSTTLTWLDYLAAEGLALEVITLASQERRRRRVRRGRIAS